MATRFGFVHDAALASEHAGRYYLRQQDSYWAAHYISGAIVRYENWNATAKVRQLEMEFKYLLDMTPEITMEYSSERIKPSISLTGRSREEVVIMEERTHEEYRRLLEPAGSDESMHTVKSWMGHWSTENCNS